MEITASPQQGNPRTAKDPVCDMDVSTENPAGGTFLRAGIAYYFCGPGCRVAFSRDAEAYISGKKRLDM